MLWDSCLTGLAVTVLSVMNNDDANRHPYLCYEPLSDFQHIRVQRTKIRDGVSPSESASGTLVKQMEVHTDDRTLPKSGTRRKPQR